VTPTASGLAWAPTLPERWKTVPLNAVARMGTGHTPDRNNAEYWAECNIPWVTTPDVTKRPHSLEPLQETEQKISRKGLANSAAVLHPADTVMLSRTASVGYSVRIGIPMATTQAFVTWTPGPELDSRFLLLVFRAMRQEWNRLAYGSTHLTIYLPDLESLRIPLPPLGEQRKIADFVEVETSRIDRLSDLRSRYLDTLSEHFESEVKVLTGRHLCWNSGEKIAPLRRAITRVKTGGTPSSTGADYFSEDEGLPWFGPSSFSEGISLGAPQKLLNEQAQLDRVVPTFRPGSILIVGIGATAGKIAYLAETASGNQQLTAIESADGVSPKFLAWQLWAARTELLELAPYTTLPIINNDFLRSFPVFLPDRKNQDRVAVRIEQSWMKLKAIKAAIEDQRALLSERRQALITAAVTGQIDVTTA
jgi:type I restriction enzyme, S subunit